MKKHKWSHSRDRHVSKHKKVKCALAVELENSISDSEGSEDSSSSSSESESDNERKHKDSKKCKLDQTDSPKVAKHHKTASAHKESKDKSKIKDEKDIKLVKSSEEKDKDIKIGTEQCIQPQLQQALSFSADTTGLRTVQAGGQITLDLTQFNALMNFVQ